MQVFCMECSSEMGANARFCEECGAPVEEITAPSASLSSRQPLQAAVPARKSLEEQPSHPRRFQKEREGTSRGYVESNLAKGEQVIARARLHWIVFFWTAVLMLSGLVMLAEGLNAQVELGIFLIAALWGVIALFTFQTSEYAVTNKRVLAKDGWVRRASLEILLTKVEGIQVYQGIFGRLLGYGYIVVRGTGGTKDLFPKIAAPFDFRRKIQEQIEAMHSA